MFQPPLPLALLVLLVSGLFDCYQLAANAEFVSAVPARQRSQAFGIAQGGMSLGQGAAMIIAGAAAQHFAPSDVVAATGSLGVIAAALIALIAVSGARTANRSGQLPAAARAALGRPGTFSRGVVRV